jgi:hypothetical protein
MQITFFLVVFMYIFFYFCKYYIVICIYHLFVIYKAGHELTPYW